jgi:type VI secretion system protein VasD
MQAHSFKALLTALGVIVLAGCSLINPGGKADLLKVNIEASPDLNPDISERPSPVVLVLYQLSSLRNFEKADFFALYEEGEVVLSSDLQAREEVQLVPGERREFTQKLQPDTRFIGAVAAYRRLEEATWRTAREVVSRKRARLALQLERLEVRFNP